MKGLFILAHVIVTFKTWIFGRNMTEFLFLCRCDWVFSVPLRDPQCSRDVDFHPGHVWVNVLPQRHYDGRKEVVDDQRHGNGDQAALNRFFLLDKF